MESKKKLIFKKPALRSEKHLELMTKRGLEVENRTDALHYLETIGYYRLSAYMKPFQEGSDHCFRSSTTFQNILDLYVFDRKLRLLFLDAIERIEVAIRAALVNDVSLHYKDTHWYCENRCFKTPTDHKKLLDEIKKEIDHSKDELSISHYRKTYDEPKTPPVWMVFECLSLGKLSRIYQQLKDTNLKRAIANRFNTHHTIFESWLRSLSATRNLCAHHARLWNRQFTKIPSIPKSREGLTRADEWKNLNNRQLYAQVLMIEHILQKIAPDSTWRKRFELLLEEYPDIPREVMNIPL